MLTLNNLQSSTKGQKKKKRRGRGDASGRGTYSGRGLKGQNSRSGGPKPPGFEGGQTPLYKRLPKTRGFKSIKIPDQAVSLNNIDKFFKDQELITPKKLRAKSLIDNFQAPVKIIGNIKLKKAFIIQAHKFSAQAAESIKKAKGQANIIEIASGKPEPKPAKSKEKEGETKVK